MSDLRRFIKLNCVYSKLAEKPVVGQHDSIRLVFIHGYPMTIKGFYTLVTRAIFGYGIMLKPNDWKVMNAETKLLCQDLGLNLEEGREALSVIEAIRVAAGWNKESAELRSANQWTYDRSFLLKWIESVEEQISDLSRLSPLDPQPQ